MPKPDFDKKASDSGVILKSAASATPAAAPSAAAGHLRLQFLGAAGFVTGSRTLLETSTSRIYVDAGLYQGPKYVEDRNYLPLETDPRLIDAIILTHAHIDHSGLLPAIVKRGFNGRIFCTPATARLLEVMLPDAGRLQEEDFRFLSKKKIRDLDIREPLYTEADAWNVLNQITTVPFHSPVAFGSFSITFYWAGHIQGAASVRIEFESTGVKKSILFSGDLGPVKNLLHPERETAVESDFVVIESTYGNRMPVKPNYYHKIISAVDYVIRSKGILLIPSFAVGRTQSVLYVLYRLLESGHIPEIPIYLDSPMARKATEVFMEFPEEIKPRIVQEGFMDFLQSDRLRMISDIADSKALNYFNGPGIILSASGMCNGGRVLHHLFSRLWDRRNMVLFAGYQAEGTIGRALVDGHHSVKVFNREIPVRAMIESAEGFSAHADQNGLKRWIEPLRDNPPEKIFINHGEDESREGLREALSGLFGSSGKPRIEMPRFESVYYL